MFPKFPESFQNSQKVSQIHRKLKKILESFRTLIEIVQHFATLALILAKIIPGPLVSICPAVLHLSCEV